MVMNRGELNAKLNVKFSTYNTNLMNDQNNIINGKISLEMEDRNLFFAN